MDGPRSLRQGEVRLPLAGASTAPAYALLTLAASGAAALVLWRLWLAAGVPLGTFQPGLAGHPADPYAWRRCFSVWLPLGYASFGLVHASLVRRRSWLARYLWWDAGTWLFVVALAGLLWRWHSIPTWAQWLRLAYPLIVATKTAILVRSLFAGWVEAPGGDRSPSRLPGYLFATSAIVYGLTAAYLTQALSTTGDEPHYLLIAHSMLYDHDVDIGNNLAHRDYLPFYWGRLAETQNLVRTSSGQVYSLSYNGLLAYLLLPGYALGGRLGAMLVMSLFAAFLATNLFLLAWELAASVRAAFLTWLFLSFSQPVFFFASQLYPEIPAAALVAWAVRTIRRLPDRSSATLPGLALALLALLLLKGRYAAIALPLLIWALARARRRAIVLGGLSLLLLVGGCLWLLDQHLGGLVYRQHYQAASWPDLRQPVEIGRSLLGLLFDQEFGLLPNAPVYLMALLGISVGLQRSSDARPLLAVLVFAVAPLLGRYWFGGFSSPSRYLVVVVPLLAPFVSWALAPGRRRWLTSCALAGWWLSIGLSLTLTIRPALRYNRATGEAHWLGAIAARLGLDIARFVPSLVNPSPETWWVLPGLLVLIAAAMVATGREARAARDPESNQPRRGGSVGAVVILVGLVAAVVAAAKFVPTTMVKAETMTAEGRGARFEGSESVPLKMWVMQSPGRLSKIVHIASGPAVVRVVAAAYSTDDEAPLLSVSLDGRPVGAVRAAAGDHEWRIGAYSFSATVSGGEHLLVLACPNAHDDRRRGRARYLGVDRVEIERSHP